MRKAKVRYLSLLFAILFSFMTFTGCALSGGGSIEVNTENPVKTEESEPSQSELSSQPPVQSKTEAPMQTEDPSQEETPLQTETPSETGNPIQSENPSQTEKPIQSENPTQTKSPETTEQPVETIVPESVFEPSEYTLFPRISSYEISRVMNRPELTVSIPIMQMEFKNPVTLYAATSPGRPSYVPGDPVIIYPGMGLIDTSSVFVDKIPVYSNGFRTAFVEEGKDETLWFACVTGTSSAASVIWQISDTAFEGNDEDWKNPPGLLKNGTLEEGEREFSVDFSKLGKPVFSIIDGMVFIRPVGNDKLNPTQKIIYVRAFAVDGAGNVIGDPGEGIQVLYGDRITYIPDRLTPYMLFPLLSGERPGILTPTGEYRNTLTDESLRFYSTDNVSPWHFRPQDFRKETDTIYIQVTRNSPGTGRDDWRDPSGLIYEVKLEKGEVDFDAFEEPYHTIPIDIKSIAGLPPDLLYVRAVALSDGPQAGTVRAEYSKTVIVKYNYASSEIEYIPPPEVIYIDAKTPEVRLVEYQPIRYQPSDWMYYYEVIRQPTYSEYYSLLPASMVPNPNKLVEGLTPGTVIYLEPKEDDDDSWWDKVKDAISDVFGSIENFISDITDWVSSKYTELKADLVELVAENFPGIPEDWRDELQDALEYMVDYGLVAVGIPPEIPNFDELTDLGADYLAATALEQAGIPADELTKDVVRDLGSEIAQHASAAASKGDSPNPMNWNWVRQYPDVMYRPAYMIVEVTNDSDSMSQPGWLSGKVYTDITSADKADPEVMSLTSAFDGSLHYELFRPYSLEIPPLYPGQTLEIPVILKEYTGAAYPFSPHVVTENDFIKMQKYLGDFTFTYYASFELQALGDYIEENNLPPEGKDRVYKYSNTGDGGNFTGDPTVEYIP